MADQTVNTPGAKEDKEDNKLVELGNVKPVSRPCGFRQVLTSWFDFVFKRDLPWLQFLTPKLFPVFDPFFAWPNFTLGSRPLATNFPTLPSSLFPFHPRAMRIFHRLLMKFSVYYSSWYGYRINFGNYYLPFGLLLKQMPSSQISQVTTIRTMRLVGIPVAKVISCAEHPGDEMSSVTALMTRVPGEPFFDAYEKLDEKGRDVIDEELERFITTIRSLESPYGQRVCGVDGGPVTSWWIPPQASVFYTEEEFVNFLLANLVRPVHLNQEEFQDREKAANTLYDKKHRSVLSFGTSLLTNVYIHKGHISGITGWQCAGFYPEYYDFRNYGTWSRLPDRLKKLFNRLGRDKYKDELRGLAAVSELT